MAKQIIKLKPADVNRAVIRGFSRSAWETKKALGLKERVQLSKKQKTLKHKKHFLDLEDEF